MSGTSFPELMERSWPPAARHDIGPFRLRDGGGGGKRVSAATCLGDWDLPALIAAEAAMTEPLFVIWPGDEELDAALAARGYRVIDPVVVYEAALADLCADVPPLQTFAHWPPLAIAAEIWAEGGIGPGRLAVMTRAEGAKCTLLARHDDHPAGVAFVACVEGAALLHALEVRPSFRRLGVGESLLRGAANWAAAQGANRLLLVVTEQNLAARALYDRLGMRVVGQYHYRGR